MKRLFIAINLPPEIKREISRLIELINSERKFSRQEGFRWLAEKNWHLTLTFLGSQPDELIEPILESIKSTVLDTKPFPVEFEKIIFGPPNKISRMIWIVGTKKTSLRLTEIKNNLDFSLIKKGINFHQENRQFNAHLTLARFFPQKHQELKNYEVESLKFTAQSIDLMESKLFRTGAEYAILEKMDFKK